MRERGQFKSLIKLAVLLTTVSISCVLLITGCHRDQSKDPLTAEEKAWLTTNDGKIVLAHDPNAKPIDYLDDKGEFRGIAADYVHLIEKKLNFKFNIVHIKTWDAVLKKAKRKEIDVLCAFAKTPDREKWLLFTKPYIVIPTVILVREDIKETLTPDKMKGMKVTFTNGWVIDEYLKKNYGYLDLVPSIDETNAMNTVSLGRADAWVTALTVASILTEKHKITNLRVAGEVDLEFKLAIASRKDWPILNQIMQKGLSLISQEERSAIFNKWIHIEVKRLISTKLWLGFIIAAATILLIIITILTWNRTLRRQVGQRTKELEEHSERLEEVVEDRTKKLQDAQEQLIRSEKLVALGKLAGLLGHEIKAPLGVIKHSFEFLKIRLDQNVDAKIGEHLNLVHAKINTMDKTIDDVLDFARTKKLELIAVDPNNLVEDLIGEIPVPTHIRIVCDLGRNLPCIAVDKRPIQQVFQNIISNAVDAMDEGGTLTVSTHKQISDNAGPEFVTISFQDTGEGITPDHIGKVFEPLFSKKVKGTGLGLVACENIIHAHKGSIEVSSELGKGSTFTVKLPVKE